MGDRIDELKGNVKEGLGKVTGNRRLRAEGETESSGARAKRRTKGSLQEAGGGLKEGLGKLTGDEGMQAKGKADRLGGKSKRTE